jgi:hypothetical protein
MLYVMRRNASKVDVSEAQAPRGIGRDGCTRHTLAFYGTERLKEMNNLDYYKHQKSIISCCDVDKSGLDPMSCKRGFLYERFERARMPS